MRALITHEIIVKCDVLSLSHTIIYRQRHKTDVNITPSHAREPENFVHDTSLYQITKLMYVNVANGGLDTTENLWRRQCRICMHADDITF